MPEPWLQKLLALQTLDLKLRSLKNRINMIPKEKTRIVEQVHALEARLKKVRDDRAACEAEIRRCEADVAALNDQSAKLKQQSTLVKKNNEYQAMLLQIDALRHGVGDLETKILELMDQLEEKKRAVSAAEKAAVAEAKTLKTEFAELTELDNEIRSEWKKLAATRPQATLGITEELLDNYERLLSKNSGSPANPIEQDKCGSCHLRLTPQTLIAARSGQLAYCDNCMHIVYAADPDEA